MRYKPGDLVVVKRVPKYYGNDALRSALNVPGVIVERGSHENRWRVYIAGQFFSLHSNHMEPYTEPGAGDK